MSKKKKRKEVIVCNNSPHEVHHAAHESEIAEVLHCIQLDSGGDGSLNMDSDSVSSVSDSIIDSNRDTAKDLEYVDSRSLTPHPVEPRPGNGNTLAFQDLPCPLQRTFAFSLPATPVVEASSPAAEVQELTFLQDHPHLVTELVVASCKPVQRAAARKFLRWMLLFPPQLLQVPAPYVVPVLLLHTTLGGLKNDNRIWTEFFVDCIVLVLRLWTLCAAFLMILMFIGLLYVISPISGQVSI
jgi:hypothetical protein